MKTNQPWVLLALLLSISACEKESNSSQSISYSEFNNDSQLRIELPKQHPKPSDFVTGIDNPYFPLKPGTVFKYINTILEDGHVVVENITVNCYV